MYIKHKKSHIAVRLHSTHYNQRQYWHQADEFAESPCVSFVGQKLLFGSSTEIYFCSWLQKCSFMIYTYIWAWTEFAQLTLIANDIWWNVIYSGGRIAYKYVYNRIQTTVRTTCLGDWGIFFFGIVKDRKKMEYAEIFYSKYYQHFATVQWNVVAMTSLFYHQIRLHHNFPTSLIKNELKLLPSDALSWTNAREMIYLHSTIYPYA